MRLQSHKSSDGSGKFSLPLRSTKSTKSSANLQLSLPCQRQNGLRVRHAFFECNIGENPSKLTNVNLSKSHLLKYFFPIGFVSERETPTKCICNKDSCKNNWLFHCTWLNLSSCVFSKSWQYS